MRRWVFLLLVGLVFLLSPACSPAHQENNAQERNTSNPPLLSTDITFFVRIPDEKLDNIPVHLILLDEVTGLPYNQKVIQMERLEAYRYGVTINVPYQSVLKYRFAAGEKLELSEFNAMGEPIRYRMYFADGPGYVDDTVAGWDAAALFSGKARITGTVIDRDSGAPLADLLVSSSGISGLTASDGSFWLEGVPPGKHLLVVYAMDGRFHTFQQEVVTTADSATPVRIEITATKLVEVTFNLRVPADTVPTVPIMLVGNLRQLGNSFGELAGGVSSRGDRLPQLETDAAGNYATTLRLPAGIFIEYKYTMGDGFWNAEHLHDGSYAVRQVVIPLDTDRFIIEDNVISWRSSNTPPIWFDLAAGEDLPQGDEMYIQFKLVDWMEPLPMWAGGEGRWGYLLNSPTNFSAPVPYRYCRNGQCGEDVGVAVELNGQVHTVPLGYSVGETLFTAAEGWNWNEGRNRQAVLPRVNANPRNEGFTAGVELADYYHPGKTDTLQKDFGVIRDTNSNTVILKPTWTAIYQNPPLFDPVLGRDLTYSEQLDLIRTAQSLGLRVNLMPMIRLPNTTGNWWATAQRDFAWWQGWFDQYRRFILHQAELAQRSNAGSLILDGEWLAPAFPGGTVLDGSVSNVPPDAGERWATLLGEIRARYSGEIFLSLDLDDNIEMLGDILKLVDGVYMQFSGEIGNGADTPLDVMAANAGILLDEVAYPISLEYDLKVIVAIGYSSATMSSSGCIPSPSGSCIPIGMLSPFELDFDMVELDLDEQTDAYNAVLMAVNERAWIDGVVSSGYYPSASLADKSPSVHGKPAEQAVWFWYKGYRGLE